MIATPPLPQRRPPRQRRSPGRRHAYAIFAMPSLPPRAAFITPFLHCLPSLSRFRAVACFPLMRFPPLFADSHATPLMTLCRQAI
jgi:hypothetical protein